MNLYFIAVAPPPELRETIRRLKEEMRDRFQAKHALTSPAHITLQMPFKRDAAEEPEIIKALGRLAYRQSAFKLELSGFGCFAPRVIFVRVHESAPLLQLHEQLQNTLLGDLGFHGKELPRDLHPHVTIATRDLSPAAFHKAWPEFEKRPFEASFEVRSLFLLKHNGRYWDMYREFLFA